MSTEFIRGVRDLAADQGHDSPSIQGLLVHVADRVAEGAVNDHTVQLAAALVEGLRAYDRRDLTPEQCQSTCGESQCVGHAGHYGNHENASGFRWHDEKMLVKP